MACKGAKHKRILKENKKTEVIKESIVNEPKKVQESEEKRAERLFFGVDSQIQCDDILQNNLTEFEWAVRNKIYPSFWGRNLVGENSLTKEEINFLHQKGCKIAAIYNDSGEKQTQDQGRIIAEKINKFVLELGIPKGTAIFLEIADTENASTNFMKGFAERIIESGLTPGFKANTDANFPFDREYSRGMQTKREIFEKCLIWAVAPTLPEYDRVTTTHLIHPDNWLPFAPSGITRNDIAIWQYGKNCHPINDDAGVETTFNVNLVKDEAIIIEKMF